MIAKTFGSKKGVKAFAIMEMGGIPGGLPGIPP
jgi:hypothetical protein